MRCFQIEKYFLGGIRVWNSNLLWQLAIKYTNWKGHLHPFNKPKNWPELALATSGDWKSINIHKFFIKDWILSVGNLDKYFEIQFHNPKLKYCPFPGIVVTLTNRGVFRSVLESHGRQLNVSPWYFKLLKSFNKAFCALPLISNLPNQLAKHCLSLSSGAVSFLGEIIYWKTKSVSISPSSTRLAKVPPKSLLSHDLTGVWSDRKVVT